MWTVGLRSMLEVDKAVDAFCCSDCEKKSHLRVLPSPAELRDLIPLGSSECETVHNGRKIAGAILDGRDSRLLVVVGPCSIHDYDGALKYASWLAEQQRRFADELFLLMRCYVEKPRTRMGWTGYVHDPSLAGASDLVDGGVASRRLMADIVATGVPIATEFVEPYVASALSDLVSWSAIGARTVESPVHRRMASGLGCPVGFKNCTDGSIKGAIDGMITAQSPQQTVGVSDSGEACIVQTSGLSFTHLVMRGGRSGPNWGVESLEAAREELVAQEMNKSIMVDLSHGNSDGTVAGIMSTGLAVSEIIRRSPELVMGVMVESNLESGKQVLGFGERLRSGVSVTDCCLGLAETEGLLEALAGARA